MFLRRVEYKWLVANYSKLPSTDQEAPGAQLAGAHAAFELLDPEYVDYSRMKVTLNKKTLVAVLVAAALVALAAILVWLFVG